ncbi:MULTISPECIES: bacterioferritin [unclassified Caballeronia]|uniref:ferritin-like domain-containing protein n=1 Tax=unclassified Caballeronia TaxID=2646786 RepID=UPI002029A717|nr:MULTISPECIES: ferritin-like domain-containing protein [unclassified Caballeronia]
MSDSSAVSTAPGQSKDAFVLDVEKIRNDARQHMDEGPVTSTYAADRETVLKLLNDALATEWVCTLRYKRHYFMAKGIHSEAVAKEFAEHATEEQEHADMLAERIVQLGGSPDFAPDSLKSRAHSEYKEGADLIDMIRENLIAERIAIDTYREIIRYLGDKDVTTRRIFEEILAVEEEHADDMADLLEGRNG